MNRNHLLPLFAFALLLSASLACQFLVPPAIPPTPFPPTQPVSPDGQGVTLVAPPPTQAPTEPPATPTQASQQFFTEEFDNGASNWVPFVTHGEISQLDMKAKDGKLSFDLKEKQLWTYALYQAQSYDDVRIDVKVENLGQNENNISLLCRYDKERGWYEFSVANSGLWWIYFGRWDSNGTTASYAVVADGGSNNIHQGQAVNTYGMTCKGNTITVFINDKELKRVTDNQHGLRHGEIGIGVSSFRRLPVTVEYDWVKISEPTQ